MVATPLFSAFYFGTVEHYALIARRGRAVVDIGEHYERQSHRTRTVILGANGPQALDVHITRRSGERMPMRTVGLSYAEPWHARHLHAIRSAYGQTPWFIHYIDDLGKLLRHRHERLADLDLATLRMALGWLGLKPELVVEETYVEPVAVEERKLWNLRHTLHPKRPLPAGVPAVGPYAQVFGDRHGFRPHLSILDLVMNHGPRAREVLLQG